MLPWSAPTYRTQGQQRGLSADTIENALQQARLLQARDLPPVLTLKHLAFQAGVDYQSIRICVSRHGPNAYRIQHIRKRLGGFRCICIPKPELLKAQRWIARHILGRIAVHSASVAYSKGDSVLKAAAGHCGCRWLIKLDVRQFFESISERQAYHVFHGLGYSQLVSFEMARICTRTGNREDGRYGRLRWVNRDAGAEYLTIATYRDRYVGHLPQGAPTSPMLSNLVMRGFDAAVDAIAAKAGVVYTRYADDLALSSASLDFTRDKALSLIRAVFGEMRRVGLRPHTAKTVVSPPGARKVVLGLLVDGDRPRLTKPFRKDLERHVHALVKFGPVAHARAHGFDSLLGLQRHVDGLLTYAQYVDREYAEALRARYVNVAWPA